MAITVKHTKVSAVADSADTSLVRPSDWNADHTLIGVGTAAALDAGVANGVATLDSGGKVPTSQIPQMGDLNYQGTWNASTNSPSLASSVGTKGYYYVVNVAGSTNLNGITDWQIGDWAVFNGSVWQKIDNTDAVVSVNGQTGVVVLNAANVGALSAITSSDGSISVSTVGSTVDLAVSAASPASTLLGQVRNETGATLTAGTVVYISGAAGNKALVSKAIATSDATSAQTYGVITADILNNQNGYATIAGSLGNLNTSAFVDGTQLYLSSTTAGAWTSTKQYAPAHLVYVGVVTKSHATQGTIEVKIQNGYEMDELHNVSAQTPSNGNVLIWNNSTQLWVSAGITAGTGISVTNGAGSIAIANTGVTSVTGTAPVVSSGGTTPAISMAAATTAVSGYLTSTDWNTFNNKTSNTGTVTSVAASVPSFLSVTGSPITTSGTLAISYSGTALPVANGGTGATTLTGYVKGTGTTAMTASSTIPNTDISGLGTMSTQNAGSVAITGGSVNGTSLGATTAASAKVTTLDIASGLTIATSAGTSGQVLTSAGAGVAPTWANPASAGVSSISFGTTGLTPSIATAGVVTVAGTLAIANGGTGATTAGAARTNFGATTVGGNFFTLSNPTAITFPRINADNTVSTLDAATFRTAIGAGTSSTTGTVTSVAMSVPTGLSIAGTPITSSGTLAVTMTAGYAIPTTASQTNWDSAYTQRLQWDGGATNLVAATGRTSLGATTVGGNFFTLANPTAITFPRINADNTVSALDAATFRTAIGAGTGSGSVTGVTATSPVASSGGTAPVISLSAGYGDTLNPYASKTANFILAAPTGIAGVPTFRAVVAADIPTLNQNTTGTAANVTGTVAIANGGSGATTAAAARTNFGATTVGGNFFTLANPTAITFPRINADNTVSALDAATFRTAIGAGTSSTTGTVTSVSVVSANGFAGTVATATTTPAITVSTSITGMLKGNGTALSAGTAGTDYVAPATETKFTAQQYFDNATLTDAATIAWAANTAQVATFTFVTSSRTVGAPTGLVNGAFYALAVIQNAGSNTLTWNTVFKWAGGTAPTLSTAAGAKDYFVFRSDGTNLYEQGRSLGVA